MRGWFQYESGAHAGIHEYAVVAQSVERFLGKEEVRQFKPAQQLQMKDTHAGIFFLKVELCNALRSLTHPHNLTKT